MEAGNIPYVEEFDVIGLFDVLEHISDDKTAIRQIHRALKPEGGLMLTVPQHAWLWSRADDEARHLRRYGRHDLLNTLEDSGFRIIQVTSFISLLLPLLIISRLLSRSETARKSSNPQWKELHLPGPIDRIFETICSWEQVLIDRKLSFPVGGSLLCIALKR
jgi:SAM-dependent methyltransferase